MRLLAFVVPLLSISCVPPYSLSSSDPTFITDSLVESPKTIHFAKVVSLIRDGKLKSIIVPHKGPTILIFENGAAIGLYDSMKKEVNQAIGDAINSAPNKKSLSYGIE